jgi:hypothetical protein
MHFAYNVFPPWLGRSEFAPPSQIPLQTVLGSRFFISQFPASLVNSIGYVLGATCFLFIMRVLLRNQMLAVAICIALWALGFQPGNFWAVLYAMIEVALLYFVLIRFGLVAAISVEFTCELIMKFPITLQASAWYAGYGFATLAILATIVLYAFRYSLSGRPLLAASRLDD